MSLFGAIHTSGNGLRTHRVWMDAVGDNIANINTVRPADEDAFRARYVVAEAIDYQKDGTAGIGGGSRVAAVAWGDAEGRIRHEPDHPFADEDGNVRYPDIDLGEQMVHLIAAQRGYQANLAVVDRAREAYLQALQIGK
jgi:flagellar basal-body rod protein FlgC